MTEADLLQAVRQLAKYNNWMTYHTNWSKGSEGGWPDLVLLHVARKRIIFAELKTEIGKVTASQQAWIDGLSACGLDARVWRPADLPGIPAELRPSDVIAERRAAAIAETLDWERRNPTKSTKSATNQGA